MPIDSTPHPSVQLLRMITAPWVSQAIYVAAKLEIADLLVNGPLSVEQLATKTQTHPQALYRVLRGLASVGIFTEREPRRFSLSELAEPLRSDVPGSMRAMAILNGEERYRTFGEVLTTVQTGEPSFEKVVGASQGQYFLDNPEADALRVEASATFSHQLDGFVAQTYDFSSIRHLVSIGGGRGTLLVTILRRYPKMHSTLLTPKASAAAAEDMLAAEGLRDRCDVLAGDIFTTQPPAGDTYLVANMLHAWDDETASHLLQNIRRSINNDGRVLAVEMVLPEGDEPHFGKVFDLFLLVMRGGLERTEAELRELFTKSGFTIESVTPTPGPVSVLSALPQFREERRG